MKFHIPLPSWKSYERGPSEPGAGALRSMAEEGVNIHWLLTGQGNMMQGTSIDIPSELQYSIDLVLANQGNEKSGAFPDANDEATYAWINHTCRSAGFIPPVATLEMFKCLYTLNKDSFQDLIKATVKELAQIQEEFVSIPFFDMLTSPQPENAEQADYFIGEMTFSKKLLNLMGLNIDKCALIQVKGDSMEPTIKYRDLLLVDTSSSQITVDGIYAIRLDKQLTIKRLQSLFDFSLNVISDNPKYETKVFSSEDCKGMKVLGLVKWHWREF